MSDFDKYFPSKYLRAQDVLSTQNVTIKGTGEDKIRDVKTGELELKPLVTFQETPKSLILNKTNFQSIAELTGTENMREWVGKVIGITVQKVHTPEGSKPAIRFIPHLPVKDEPIITNEEPEEDYTEHDPDAFR
jgi:hypothetical protein